MRPHTQIHDRIRYVRVAQRSGLLQQRGAKAELARILGVSTQYISYLLRRIAEEGASENGVTGADGLRGEHGS